MHLDRATWMLELKCRKRLHPCEQLMKNQFLGGCAVWEERLSRCRAKRIPVRYFSKDCAHCFAEEERASSFVVGQLCLRHTMALDQGGP
jgi:hypothetical protein